jgi:hypothetical protein
MWSIVSVAEMLFNEMLVMAKARRTFSVAMFGRGFQHIVPARPR